MVRYHLLVCWKKWSKSSSGRFVHIITIFTPIPSTDGHFFSFICQAERSDLSSRPNLYKVLYSFEAYRNNWRKAAAYMYRYFVRLSREGDAGGSRQLSHLLQEKLHALSTAINSLQLVEPSCAWLDSVCEADDQVSPSKKPRNLLMENCMFT
jgi:nuclear pore complex protein Nup160